MSDLVFIEEKPMEGREHTLAPGATIGREGCDLVLADPEVSRRHAAIRASNGGVAVEDLGSTNGTFVNEERVEGVRELKDGDRVRFGNTVLLLRDNSAQVGGPRLGAPQVTAARAVPADVQVTTARPAPAPAPAPPVAPVSQPAEPAAPSATPVGVRGDVPPPPAEAPSAIRRVLPAEVANQPPAFAAPPARKRGSVATRVEATVICWIVVLAVAVGVAIYFATY